MRTKGTISALVVALLVTAGCSRGANDTPATAPPAPASSAPESEQPSATSSTPAASALPDVCSRWGGAQVARSLSSTDYGSATVVRSETVEGTVACDWALPEPLRRELGMDPTSDTETTSVEIRLFPYPTDLSLEDDGSEVVAGPEDLVPVRTMDPSWRDLGGSPQAVAADTPVVNVATSGPWWFELSLFQCRNDQCLEQAVKAARELSSE